MSDHPDSPEPPDLDLIQRVQRARMQHDQEATPSTVGGVYWIEAKRQGDGPAPTSRAGHFIVMTTLADVDTLWAKVKQATEAGALGYKSKVATASRTPNGLDRVIHVLTYDADDLADVDRVARGLAALDIDRRRTAAPPIEAAKRVMTFVMPCHKPRAALPDLP